MFCVICQEIRVKLLQVIPVKACGPIDPSRAGKFNTRRPIQTAQTPAMDSEGKIIHHEVPALELLHLLGGKQPSFNVPKGKTIGDASFLFVLLSCPMLDPLGFPDWFLSWPQKVSLIFLGS